jgi:Sec-independent protein translocase protein TatA
MFGLGTGELILIVLVGAILYFVYKGKNKKDNIKP